MRYVALLRGINVGGNNIIPMKALAKTFERLALASVRTYIASGNVLFETEEKDARALEQRIEAAVEKAHRCAAKVVVRSRPEMKKVVAGIPRDWDAADRDMRYNVLFLRHELDGKKAVAGLAVKPDVEHVSYKPGVIYWSAHRKDLTRTTMVKLSTLPIYKYVTVRNLNTTRKLAELLDAGS